MKALLLVFSLAASAVTGLSAQTLTGVKLDPAQGMASQNVTATIALDAKDTAYCGLRVNWGDGATQEIKVADLAAIPYKATHAYAKGGDYQVMVEPKKVGSHLGCVGKKVSVAYKVVAAAVAAAPAGAASAAMKVAGPSCPEGWKLDTKSVVKKTGAYNCTAKPGTAAPEKKPVCPGDLTYSENSKKGMLGCKP
ncbi:MAG: hypothetical protein RIS34_90 [Pseudomonadota bacterium]|jgi:hypothetical protein